ncbi:hypothetical protein Btru_040074 [Bulinus truncatus]|nr:hypothetical protein Btru_040074 [Bulinus truncatus]
MLKRAEAYIYSTVFPITASHTMTANIGVILYEYLGFLFCSSLSTVQAYSSQSVSVFSNTSVCSDALMINKDFIEIKSEVTYIEEVAQPGDRFTLEFINTSTNKTFKQCNFTYLDDCAKDNGLCVCSSNNVTFFKVLYRAPAIMEYNYSAVRHRGFFASRKIPFIVSDTVNVSLKVNNHDAVELPEGEPCKQSIRSHVGSKVFFKFCATGLHKPALHISYTGRNEKSEEAECVFLAPVYNKSMVSATFRYEDKCNRTRTIECPFEGFSLKQFDYIHSGFSLKQFDYIHSGFSLRQFDYFHSGFSLRQFGYIHSGFSLRQFDYFHSGFSLRHSIEALV